MKIATSIVVLAFVILVSSTAHAESWRDYVKECKSKIPAACEKLEKAWLKKGAGGDSKYARKYEIRIKKTSSEGEMTVDVAYIYKEKYKASIVCYFADDDGWIYEGHDEEVKNPYYLDALPFLFGN